MLYRGDRDRPLERRQAAVTEIDLAVKGTAVPGVKRAPGPVRVSRVRNVETPLGSALRPGMLGGAVGRS